MLWLTNKGKFLKGRSEQSKIDYRKQRNLYVTLLSMARQQYFFSLNPNISAVTKNFGNCLNHFSYLNFSLRNNRVDSKRKSIKEKSGNSKKF